MIKFESNMLVLNNAFSNEDVEEISAFAEYVRSQERERIVELLKDVQNIYNLKSMDMNEFSHGQYEGITEAIALIRG